MLKERPFEELKNEEFLKLSELARLLPESRSILSKYAFFDLLPWHIPPGRKAKYYRLNEVKKVLRAIEPLRAKEIPKKHLREELNRISWYKEMRSRESAGE